MCTVRSTRVYGRGVTLLGVNVHCTCPHRRVRRNNECTAMEFLLSQAGGDQGVYGIAIAASHMADTRWVLRCLCPYSSSSDGGPMVVASRRNFARALVAELSSVRCVFFFVVFVFMFG